MTRQYKSRSPAAMTATPAVKQTQNGIASKVSSLEELVQKQSVEIAKLRRDMSRMKADIEILSNQLAKRG